MAACRSVEIARGARLTLTGCKEYLKGQRNGLLGTNVLAHIAEGAPFRGAQVCLVASLRERLGRTVLNAATTAGASSEVDARQQVFGVHVQNPS